MSADYVDHLFFLAVPLSLGVLYTRRGPRGAMESEGHLPALHTLFRDRLLFVLFLASPPPPPPRAC